VTVVGHLADERAVVGPGAELTLPADVPKTVGGNLIDRPHYRPGGLLVQPGLPGAFGDERPHGSEAAGLEGQVGGIGRPGRQRPGKRVGEVDRAEGAAGLPVFAPGGEQVVRCAPSITSPASASRS
jgi:hypothetical protein